MLCFDPLSFRFQGNGRGYGVDFHGQRRPCLFTGLHDTLNCPLAAADICGTLFGLDVVTPS